MEKFKEACAPVIHLLAHSLAAAIGFAGLAAISLIPLGVLKLLVWGGLENELLVTVFTFLEYAILVVDVSVFGVVFGIGVVHFLAEVVAKLHDKNKK